MQITQVSNQFIQPPTRANKDPIMNSIMKAKENLTSQMKKLNEDKSIDENTKQAKLKQLQTQIDELEQQMSKRQLEKLVEDSTKTVTESSNSSSDSNKTAEERKNEANTAIGKSIIAASVNQGHLTHLGAIRSRLISEDGENSERVRRTEGMMAARTEEINKSLEENRKAVQEYTQSSKEVEENKQSEKVSESQENVQNVDKAVTATAEDAQEPSDTEQSGDAVSSTAKPRPQEDGNSIEKPKRNDSDAQRPIQAPESIKAHQKSVLRENDSKIDMLL